MSARERGTPGALIFADSNEGSLAAADAVLATGGQVIARLGLDEAADRLDRQAAMDAIVVDLSVDHGGLADRLLDRIGDLAEIKGIPAIVTAPLALIDNIDARLSGAPVTLLCEPDMAERVYALAMAWFGQPSAGVADISADPDPVRLRRLADEVARIARALTSLSGANQGSRNFAGPTPAGLEDVQSGFSAQLPDLVADLPSSGEVRCILRLRRLRESFFDSALFADPAWDMLLDLLSARLDGDQVAVSSLCIAAAVPPTTALRWIRGMTDHGLFERHADPMDGRRIFIRLSDTATNGMARYFAAAKRVEGMIV